MHDYVVVGSGPSGVSAAAALLKNGKSVLMLDTGFELESWRSEAILRMSSSSPENWLPSDENMIRAGMRPDINGVPLKLSFGSDFPYRNVHSNFQMKKNVSGARLSTGKGGLSNVWGACVLPYRQKDIEDWCIPSQFLSSHYEEVLKLMRVRNGGDNTDSLFPNHGANVIPLKRSTQAEFIKQKLDANSGPLKKTGVSYGTARIAFNKETRTSEPGGDCNYCGHCMYGCPYRLIYSADQTVEELKKNPRFKYQPGYLVHSVSEKLDEVVIGARDLKSNSEHQFKTARVFLACGTLSTTALILKTLNAYGTPLAMLDTQIFLMPSFLNKTAHGSTKEKNHALTQLFIQIENPEISQRGVHLQIYTFNLVFLDVFRFKLKMLFPIFRFFVNLFLDRFVLVQGFLHSNESSRLKVSLEKSDDSTCPDSIHIHAPNPDKTVGKRVLSFLKKNSSLFGFRPLGPLMSFPDPGRSYHFGGTFPMRKNPTHFESNEQGVPFGLKRIHAVDASVFPSIPGSTVTLTAMANAHRIAHEVSK